MGWVVRGKPWGRAGTAAPQVPVGFAPGFLCKQSLRCALGWARAGCGCQGRVSGEAPPLHVAGLGCTLAQISPAPLGAGDSSLSLNKLAPPVLTGVTKAGQR